nr:MAG TPA: hypothetical protein [Myoviridae sp. ctDOq19]
MHCNYLHSFSLNVMRFRLTCRHITKQMQSLQSFV